MNCIAGDNFKKMKLRVMSVCLIIVLICISGITQAENKTQRHTLQGSIY